jgi:hypothetical protein
MTTAWLRATSSNDRLRAALGQFSVLVEVRSHGRYRSADLQLRGRHLMNRRAGRIAKDTQTGIGLLHLQTGIETLKTYAFEHAQGGRTTVRREPIGVIGIITPWNWPINPDHVQGRARSGDRHAPRVGLVNKRLCLHVLRPKALAAAPPSMAGVRRA